MVSYYNRRNSNVSPVFRCGGRTDVLSYIYNPSKPPFEKGGLWQDLVLHCFAIVIAASKSRINRLEISIWCPTIEEIRKDFLFFCLCLQALLLRSPRATVVGGNVCKHPSHLPLHHATFGGTLATITLMACIGGSTTHLNVGGCADRIESIARPLVCAIMYPRYGFAVRVLSHIYNPPKPSFKCTSFLFVASVRHSKRVCSALALIATLIRRACGKALPCIC